MNVDPPDVGQSLYHGEERRGKPRIYEDFPVRVWSVDADGRKFEVTVPAANLSASGICVNLPCEVEVGEEILVLIGFSGLNRQNGPRVGACGTVVRSAKREQRTHSEWETAVRFMADVVI